MSERQVMTCDLGCEKERSHYGRCGKVSGFDSDLLTADELALIPRFALGMNELAMVCVDHTIAALTIVCNQRRELKRLKGEVWTNQ